MRYIPYIINTVDGIVYEVFTNWMNNYPQFQLAHIKSEACKSLVENIEKSGVVGSSVGQTFWKNSKGVR